MLEAAEKEFFQGWRFPLAECNIHLSDELIMRRTIPKTVSSHTAVTKIGWFFSGVLPCSIPQKQRLPRHSLISVPGRHVVFTWSSFEYLSEKGITASVHIQRALSFFHATVAQRFLGDVA